MSELVDLLKTLLNDDALQALGTRSGLDGEEAATAVGIGLPTLLGGLAGHATQPDGADELLDRIRATDRGKNLDETLGGLRAKDPDPQDGSAEFVDRILGGGAAGGILESLAGRLGLDKGVVVGLLGALVPLVLGALGRIGGLGGLSSSRLRGLLEDGTVAAADATPDGRAGIASLLGPFGAALALGGAGATGADAATAEPAEAREVAATVTTSASETPPADDRDQRVGVFPWWLLAAAVLVAGLIIAFANMGSGDDNAGATAPSTETTATTTSGTGGNAGVTDATPATFLTARAAGASGVVLDGPVPDDTTKSALADGATTVFGAGNVDDRLHVDAAAGGPAPEAVEATLGALANAPRGWTAIWGSPDVLTLVGEVASAADKTAIVAAATAAFAPGTVVDKLTVAAGSAVATAGSSPEINAINQEIRLRGVNFVTGSADLTPASRATLDRIAAILAKATDVRAQVQGHTDDQGDAVANQSLSQRRAQSVVAYLVGKGIARTRLIARGFGETQPIAPNTTDTGRAKNRRVVFRRR